MVLEASKTLKLETTCDSTENCTMYCAQILSSLYLLYSVHFILFYFIVVDGGWSDWREFQPCTAAKCGNGTRMLKRFCSNPTPENGGQFCAGSSIKIEPCQDICPGKIVFSCT